jgi:uncharacterized membrane protein YbhN (UPF0104 family)
VIEIATVVADADPGWVVAACGATAASLVAAVRNLTAFAPCRLRLPDALRAQLAVCGLRIVAPSAVSTPLVCARYLSRCGLDAGQALAVVGTAQTAQLLMTVVVVAVLAGFGLDGATLPNPAHLGLWGLAAVAAAALAVALSRHIAPVRRVTTAAWTALREVFSYARSRPLTAASGLAASASLTLAHVAAFASCVAAVGGHASALTLAGIYLAAASAGSLVPTPAGLGAVEATLIGGLVAAGLPGTTATAAALLTRVITVWALAVPGWWALRSLRRRGLL